MKIDVNDPVALRAAFTELLSEQRSVYAGLVDRVPPSFKAEVEKIKGRLDTKLAALADQPVAQVPAAQAGAAALESLASMLAWMQEMYLSTMKHLDALVNEIGPRDKVLGQLQSRIAAGELLEKAAAEETQRLAVEKAVQDAVAAERTTQSRLAVRRQTLASASLLVPTQDTVLDGTDDEFNARVEAAKARVAKLDSIGVLSQLEGGELADLSYGPEKAFEQFLKLAGRARQVAEPLVGGGTPRPKSLLHGF